MPGLVSSKNLLLIKVLIPLGPLTNFKPCSALKTRIGLTSQIYSVWTVARSSQLQNAWLEAILPKQVMGGRKGCGTDAVWISSVWLIWLFVGGLLGKNGRCPQEMVYWSTAVAGNDRRKGSLRWQGIPLLAVMACIWSASWVRSANQLLLSLDRYLPELAMIDCLDDWRLASKGRLVVTQGLGHVVLHFNTIGDKNITYLIFTPDELF